MSQELRSGDIRSQLRATPIKKLKRRINEDNEIIGAQSNEYLNLEDGKTIKIRIFPAHPGVDDFYIPKKCYWLTVTGKDGDPRRTTVLDSRVHGGTKFDIVEEYVKAAKKKCIKDSDKIDAITGTNQNQNSLNPSYTWICYADKVNGEDELKAKIWEFKKSVRDALNKLAFSEDEDEPIEVDPFTDVDEGMPVLVKYMKTPNKKKGENYYEVSFPKKASARTLSDSEIEYFMTLKPLNEILPKYGIKDFEKALEGLQNFDEEHEIGLFDDEAFLEHVEEIKSQYDNEEKVEEKVVKKTIVKKTTEEEEEESDDESKNSLDVDEFDEMDRHALKIYIKKNSLDIIVKKSMSDDDIRNLIRESTSGEVEVEDEENDEENEDEEIPKSKISLEDIRRKLANK